MTEEVQKEVTNTEEQQGVGLYLGMNELQFGALITLSSVSRQLQKLVVQEDCKAIMRQRIQEHPKKTPIDNLAWVHRQRNELLALSGVVNEALVHLAQIDDALITEIIMPKNPIETKSTIKEENV